VRSAWFALCPGCSSRPENVRGAAWEKCNRVFSTSRLPTVLMKFAGHVGHASANPNYNWAFVSVPRQHSNDRPGFQPQGEGFGWVIDGPLYRFAPLAVLQRSCFLQSNILVWSRPPKVAIDRIEIIGHKGWNWDIRLLYFLRVSVVWLVVIRDY